MSLTLTQVAHHTPSPYNKIPTENTAFPSLSPNKRVHTDGPGAHLSVYSEGKRRQLSFSEDRGVASTDVKTSYVHMTGPKSARTRSLSESDTNIPLDGSGTPKQSSDKGKGRVAEVEEEATQPESNKGANGSGSNEDPAAHSLDLLVKSFRPRNDPIPNRPSSSRVPSVRTPPQELWNITVLQPLDYNADGSSSSSSSSKPTPLAPLTPPGLTKRPSSTLQLGREPNMPNIVPPSGSSSGISSSSNITDNVPPAEGSSSHTDNTASTSITNTTAEIAGESSSSTPLPELVSWPPPSSLLASEFGLPSIPKVQPYPDWNVPPSPVLSHRRLPMDKSPPSPQLASPQPRHLGDLYPPHDHAYSGHFNPFAEWSNDWVVRSRKTYVDYLAKKREKNPYAPAMPSFANPIRATAPSQAWLYLPEGKYTGSRPSPRRYKHPLLAFEAKQRSRYGCDQYNEPRVPRFFLESCRHCRHCNNDSLCKKLLALKFNQHQLRLGLLDVEDDDDSFLSIPELSDSGDFSESDVSEDGPEDAVHFDTEHFNIVNSDSDENVPDSPVIRDMDSFDDEEEGKGVVYARTFGDDEQKWSNVDDDICLV